MTLCMKFVKMAVTWWQNNQKGLLVPITKKDFSGDFLFQQRKRSCFSKGAMEKLALAESKYCAY